MNAVVDPHVDLKSDQTERRLDNRVTMNIPCTFVLGNGDIVGAATRDISASGVAISTQVKPPRGTQIHLHFEGCGVHAGEISRLFEGGFAVHMTGSSLAVLALTQDDIISVD